MPAFDHTPFPVGRWLAVCTGRLLCATSVAAPSGTYTAVCVATFTIPSCRRARSRILPLLRCLNSAPRSRDRRITLLARTLAPGTPFYCTCPRSLSLSLLAAGMLLSLALPCVGCPSTHPPESGEVEPPLGIGSTEIGRGIGKDLISSVPLSHRSLCYPKPKRFCLLRRTLCSAIYAPA